MKGVLYLVIAVLLASPSVLLAERKPANKAAPKAPPSTAGSEADYVIEKKGDTTIKYKKKTSYDFEGASIDGLYNKPSGSYISNIKDVRARSIIKVRENFDAEVIDSGRLVK